MDDPQLDNPEPPGVPKPAAVPVSRRLFLHGSAAAVGIAAASFGPSSQAEPPTARGASPRPDPSFLDVLRVPDSVRAYGAFEKTLPTTPFSLSRTGERWTGPAVVVETTTHANHLVVTLAAPTTPISVLHLRWQIRVSPEVVVLGDAWERSYGELGWRSLVPERVLPWYFATLKEDTCHGYGVRTDARALCFWQLDADGVSLWLNVTNGGNGVELAGRTLTVATVSSRRGDAGEDAIDAVRALCRQLCARETRPVVPIYGANDWCYSYGQSTAATILRDTEFIVEVSPTGGVRPFSVIDGGWENGTAAWPDTGRLAADIRATGARPGIWTRPLEAARGTEARLLLPDARFGERSARASEVALDPTVPAARERIRSKLSQLSTWGYAMVKHDFSTYDLLGQWGFEMGPQPTLPGWSLHDRSRTNAEVIADLYELIREAVGPAVLLDGCNTMGHLGQGVFDLQRTGDDTSGHQWERTRRMGVNTLTFRLPQHGAFFIQDADVVGITEAIPWNLNRQWLDALARSGTATIVSAGPPARGKEQRAALREAFVIASGGGLGLQPQNWTASSAPEQWRQGTRFSPTEARNYNWSGDEGASPFLGP